MTDVYDWIDPFEEMAAARGRVLDAELRARDAVSSFLASRVAEAMSGSLQRAVSALAEKAARDVVLPIVIKHGYSQKTFDVLMSEATEQNATVGRAALEALSLASEASIFERFDRPGMTVVYEIISPCRIAFEVDPPVRL